MIQDAQPGAVSPELLDRFYTLWMQHHPQSRFYASVTVEYADLGEYPSLLHLSSHITIYLNQCHPLSSQEQDHWFLTWLDYLVNHPQPFNDASPRQILPPQLVDYDNHP